eukprot:607633-Rhodomonas_salina.1
MLSWPILNRLRQQYGLDTIVGATALEAPQLFQTWLTPTTGYDIDTSLSQLILLDAIPRAERDA